MLSNRFGRIRVMVTIVSVAAAWTAAPVVGAGPNGSKIAFEGDRFSSWGLSVMKPDGAAASELFAPYGAADVSWSPNGKMVAFEGDPNGDGNIEIFVMNVDGTNLQQLTDSPERDYWPDWFPDGRQIAFTSLRSGVPNIYIMNADGSDQHALTDEVEFGSFEPDVAPNGKRVLFMRARQFEPPTIWTIDTDGVNLTQLTQLGPYEDLDPQWSPNGKRIVFSSNRSGTYEIVVMNADGTGVTQLTVSPGADFNPTFSPDGQQIAWWKLRGGQGDVWVMNTDGSGQINITNTPGSFEGFPDWHQGQLGK
jgi:TolB protein